MNELIHISAFYSLILLRSARLSRVESALQDLAREQNKPLPPGTIFRPVFIQRRCIIHNLDEERIESAIGNKKLCFGRANKSRKCCVFISDVGIRGIHLYLNLGTVKFIHLN